MLSAGCHGGWAGGVLRSTLRSPRARILAGAPAGASPTPRLRCPSSFRRSVDRVTAYPARGRWRTAGVGGGAAAPLTPGAGLQRAGRSSRLPAARWCSRGGALPAGASVRLRGAATTGRSGGRRVRRPRHGVGRSRDPVGPGGVRRHPARGCTWSSTWCSRWWCRSSWRSARRSRWPCGRCRGRSRGSAARVLHTPGRQGADLPGRRRGCSSSSTRSSLYFTGLVRGDAAQPACCTSWMPPALRRRRAACSSGRCSGIDPLPGRLAYPLPAARGLR